MPKVLVTEKIHPCGPQILTDAGYEVIYLKEPSQAELAEKIKDVDVIFTRILDIPPDMLKTASKLKMISKHGVGMDNIPLEACKEHGITVTMTPDANGLSVAEFAFSLMITLAKKIIPVSSGYKTEGFDARNSVGSCVELTGKTLGVVGYGRIGSRVAKMAKGGLDMRVLVYDPYPAAQVSSDYERVEKLEELFSQSDFITLHLPLIPSTHHLINANALNLMKPTAYLINCARGPIIDESALIEALKSGRLAGAGLDVSDPEPASPDSPLFSLPNVILTPHYAPYSLESAIAVSKMAAENIIAFFEGSEIIGKVV